MLTMLLYVLIVGLVAALLFLVASAIFGRSEELGPLPEGTTVTVLPASGISGCDVRALRFQQVFRGYKAGEVDWALTRLAARIDELEGQLARATAGEQQPAASESGPATAHAAPPQPAVPPRPALAPQTGTQPHPAAPEAAAASRPDTTPRTAATAQPSGPLAGIVGEPSSNGAEAPIPRVLPGEPAAAPAERGDEPGAR